MAARVYYPVLRESVKGLTKAVALSDNMLKGHKDTFKVVPDSIKNPESNLKKLKDIPELKSSDDVKISVYEADMSEEI